MKSAVLRVFQVYRLVGIFILRNPLAERNASVFFVAFPIENRLLPDPLFDILSV